LCVIFITINPFYLDVNVSPTKSEIRFRDSNYIQKFISDSIKKNLDKFDRVSLTVDNNKLGFNNDGTYINNNNNFDYTTLKSNNNDMKLHDITYDNNHHYKDNNKDDIVKRQQTIGNFNANKEDINKKLDEGISKLYEDLNIKPNDNIDIFNESNKKTITSYTTIDDNFFGEPMGQFLDTYIICKTQNELVIIDQHAVHEKIKMENIKSNLNKNNKQYLINPIKLELNNKQLFIAMTIISKLNEFGFIVNINEKILVVNAIPNILSDINVEQFFYDVLEDDFNINEIDIDDCIRIKIATSACHNSIRGGRKLSMQEMKETIQEMQKTFSIHQCNHNRPSFIKITVQQLDKIFERS
ncbi:MAG: hypothetical protein IJ848_04230, partial [Alphaproteobacteria bacterium]|nr:hypothetical protein [Alphaproteobacteria bacterium]